MKKREYVNFSEQIETLVRKIEARTLKSKHPEIPGYLLFDYKNDPSHVEVVLDTDQLDLPIGLTFYSKKPVSEVVEERAEKFISAIAKQNLPMEVDELPHMGVTRPRITLKLENSFETVQQLRAVYEPLLIQEAIEQFNHDPDKENALEHATDFIQNNYSKHAAERVLHQFTTELYKAHPDMKQEQTTVSHRA